MTARLIEAKQKLLEHLRTWKMIENEYDTLIGQRERPSAQRRLASLYELFASKTPSQAALSRWLAPPQRGLTDFKLYKLHRGITAAINRRVSATDDDWDRETGLASWIHVALKLEPAELERRIRDACDDAAIKEGRGPSAAAMDILVRTDRFGSERTIWRAIGRHRRQLAKPTRRPHRPRRAPVPAR